MKTRFRFQLYGTDNCLSVRGRAKVQLRAKAGFTIATYMFLNDSDRDSSLLGKEDAVRLGIVTVNLAGSANEIDQEGCGVDQRVNRLKMLTLQDLQIETSSKQNDNTEDKMKKIVQEYPELFGRVGKY